MADDYTDDTDSAQPEELSNPVVRKAIEDVYTAFFDATAGHNLKYGELTFAVADAMARVARDIYANIEASDHDDVPDEEEFAFDVMYATGERLEALLGIELNVEDDAEVNEDMVPYSVTTH